MHEISTHPRQRCLFQECLALRILPGVKHGEMGIYGQLSIGLLGAKSSSCIVAEGIIAPR